ncbi:9002_t:CDS:1 [Dentiscutata erythropus]|uniref:9002_t:CDS:1 n=1 Tax=Dentiscutata erythropus TaxID=1348616 RepID=A0A9N9J9H9_9GLOM|nr:9002_t:CDS:1 [Dentiscutata erythropus]
MLVTLPSVYNNDLHFEKHSKVVKGELVGCGNGVYVYLGYTSNVMIVVR